MKIAYSYGRFSSAQQEYGDSRRRQLESAKKWCAENGYVLSDRQFFDKAKSATKGENFKPEADLMRFVKLHEEGEIEKGAVLILDSIDRFSRLPVHVSTEYFLHIINAGIRVVFAGSYDKRIISAELLARPSEVHTLYAIIAGLSQAHGETSEKSRKIRESLGEKRRRMQSGIVIKHNNVPRYFQFVENERIGKERRGAYIKHPENVKIVMELVEGILAGRSMYSMALDFNNRNIPSVKAGEQWHRNSIRSILRSRTLVGEFLGIKGYVERILDDETFNKVQHRLNENVKSRGRKANNLANVFKGIAYCAECGAAVTACSHESKGIQYRYLRCSNYGTRNSCKKAYMPLDEIEKEFFFYFLCKNPYNLVNEDDKAELKSIRKEVAGKVARQGELSRKISSLVKLAGDDSMPVEELGEELRSAKNEQDKLKKQIDALNAKAAAIQDIPKDANAWVAKVTHYGSGEKGENVTHVFTQETIDGIRKALKDNAAREQIRALLPSMIGKIVIDSRLRQFAVFNRVGKRIYQSGPFPAQDNNTSERWWKGIQSWTHRKTASGQIVECKRYQSRYYDYKHGKPGEVAAPKAEKAKAKNANKRLVSA